MQHEILNQNFQELRLEKELRDNVSYPPHVHLVLHSPPNTQKPTFSFLKKVLHK